MADEKIVTSIVANSDFSNLIADVQRVTNSLFKLQQEFAGANRALAGQIDATNAMFNQTMLKTGQFSSHFVSLTSDVEKFGRNLDSGRLKLRDYFRVYQEHSRTSGGLIRDLAKQQVQLQNAVLQPLGKNAQGLMQYNVHIPRGLDLTKNKASLLKQELQIMNKVIQDGGVQLINWGKNTQWAGRQLTVGLTLPLAAFGKAAADAFKVADQELTRLTKVYGDVAGTSAQELAKVRDEVSLTAKELSSAMGVSFAETISLAADIAATGKTGNELLSSVSETTRLAVLGEVDRQEAMKATLAIQSAFKANTEELSESINFLNAVENQTSTTLNDLVEAIPKAGPVIKGLGGSIQDLALYLTAMREGGINASEGANALKSALASLINPTDVAVDKFKGFGIDLLGIVKNNAGDVTSTLFALQSALDQLDPLSKQQAIEQLFGKFQFSRLNALFENLGRQGSQTLQVLDLMQASAGELEAVAGRELAAVTESAAGKYRRAIEGLKADLAGVGEEFLNIGTKLINVLSGIIDFSQKLPDPIKKLMAFGGAFTAIIGPIIMLTGVLANFFGYIIKGLGHFKALFKGAEGFKLLTPEIMAARAASEQLGNEFYSDARATETLRLAIEKLNEDLTLLQANARKATQETAGLGRVLATPAGAPIGVVGGPRVVDPSSPFLGGQSRAAAHLNPRNPNDPSTIFGLTMQPIPVNRRIGANPQILMSERLPDVPGLTTVSGVSTGVVAAEHAKYSALMATLGVQSKQEIDALKKIIGLGGQVSQELLDTFDDILPITQKLTANAAKQSAQIVAELKAGKLNIDQARAAIIAVNADLERSMGVQISSYAASRGRTIDLSKAPLIDQPVVDAAGKPNVRGQFRQGIFQDVMSALGRATGTRTFGGPYSIETTRPIQRNMGGGVFYNNGDQVPGPSVNADIVPAMLTPGEFVIRRDVAQSDPDGMRALNEGRATIVPFNSGGSVPSYFNGGAIIRAFAARSRMVGGLRTPNLRPGSTSGPSTINAAESGVGLSFGQVYRRRSSIYSDKAFTSYGISPTQPGEFLVHGMVPGFLRRTSGLDRAGSSAAIPSSRLQEFGIRTSSRAPYLQALPSQFIKNTQAFNDALKSGALASDFRPVTGSDMVSLLLFLKDQGISPQQAIPIAENAAKILNSKVLSSRGKITEATFGRFLNDSSISAIHNAFRVGRNRGGKVPGYANGGRVSRSGNRNTGGYARGVQNRFLGGSILRMLAPLAIMQGGTMLGNRVGGGTGSAISMASQFLPFMMYPGMLAGMRGGISARQRLGLQTPSTLGPTLAEQMGLTPSGPGMPVGGPTGMRQSVFAGTKYAGGIANMAESTGRFVPIVGKALAGITKLNVALGIGTTAVAAAYKIWQNYNETQRLSASAFGLTAESAEKAGLKFTDYNTKIKDAVAAQKLMIDQNTLTYESLQSAGTPFKMTIEEYKKLRKELKDTMAEQIKVINATSRPDAARVAVQLKEQLMAAGLSAEEAAKRIYTLFNLSNKAGQAVSVINTDAFKQIVDAQTAAASALQSFNYAKNFENTRDAASALNTALTAINTGVEDLVSKSEAAARKKGQEFDETTARYEAEKKQLEVIASKVKSQEAIGQDVLNNLKKQNPEIEKFVNSQDTAVSVFQKLRLVARGFTGDLAELNAQQVDAVYKLQIATSQAVEQVNKTGLLASQYKAYNQLKKQRDDLAKAAKGQSVREQIDSREALRALDKKINAIRKEAEERKKALREQQQDANVSLEIQKKQLEYQDMLATGNVSGAAQIQLDIEKLVGEQQLTLTERAIDTSADKRIAPLEAERERLQKAQEDLADKAALAGEGLDSMNKRLAKQKQQIDAVNVAMTNLKVVMDLNKNDLTNFKQSEEFKGLAAKLVEAVRGTGQVVASSGLPDVVGGVLREDIGTLATDLLSKYGSEITTIVAQKGLTVTATGDIKINGKKVDMDESNTTKTSSGQTFGAPKQTIEAKTLKEAGQLAQTGKKTQTYVPATGGAGFDVFDWQGKTYAIDKQTGIIYNFDSKNQKLGPKAKYASGGLLRGPGTGTSDSILAQFNNGGMVRVSDGEYIVNADTVSRLGVPFFDRINGMKNGGLMLNYDIPKFGGGGLLGYNEGGSLKSPGNALYNINVQLNGTNLDPNDVARAISREMQMREAMNGRVRTIGG